MLPAATAHKVNSQSVAPLFDRRKVTLVLSFFNASAPKITSSRYTPSSDVVNLMHTGEDAISSSDTTLSAFIS